MFKRPVKELMDSIIAQVSRGCIHIINHTKSWVQDDIKMAGYYFPVLWKEVKWRSITTQRKDGGDIRGRKNLFYGEKTIFCGTSAGNVEWARWAYLKLGTRLGFSFCCFTPLLAFLFPTAESGPRLILSARVANLNTDNTCRIRLINLRARGFSHWIINNYRTRLSKISWFVSGEQINHLPQPSASANNWSARHW